MSSINQNRYDQLVRRVMDLQGPGSKVNDVLTELFPMFDVENMPIELLRLSDTRVCMGGGLFVAVAAASPTAQLFNPVDSGKLVTITTVNLGFALATQIRWGVTVAVRGAALGTELFRDTRDLVPDLPTADVRAEVVAALASGTNQTRSGANSNFTLQDPDGVAVLAPGSGFEIGAAVQNNGGNFGFTWRERVAEPSELNL